MIRSTSDADILAHAHGNGAPGSRTKPSEPVLSVRDLSVSFLGDDSSRQVVTDVSFDVYPGETLAIVGESGSGKTVTALSIVRLLSAKRTRIGGEIRLAGRNLLNLSEAEMRDVRGKDIGIVFQEPMTSLNPVMTVGRQIAEVLERHRNLRGAAARAEVLRLLERVRISNAAKRFDDHPNQLSGGLRQRVMIAMALAGNPRMLIADDPTTALDVTVQAEILDLLRQLQREDGVAVLFITHDMAVVAEIADRTMVMYRGKVVETAKPIELLRAPEHIYTRFLLSAVPVIPEHRQMGACLRSWSSWLVAVAELLSRQAADKNGELKREAATWVRRCQHLGRRISALAKVAPFAEAGEAKPQLALSSVFRNDPAYRRFFLLWQDMNLGIASVFGDFLNLPLARTFELYELWCFLRLVRAAAELYGGAGLDIRDLFVSDAAGGVTIVAGATTVPVGGGWKLCFQKQYREYWIEPDRRGSFSRAMAPDIVAMIGPAEAAPEGRLIVLDSKYRIEDGLNDALSSIHTYRDALVRETPSGEIAGIVTAAYLLAPYVPELRPAYRDTKLPGGLFHPDYRAGFRFGAVTLRPGMTSAEISDALRMIVADAIAPGAIP